MEYLLKASAVLFLFYFLYKLFLQRETFFQANRLFLLIGMLSAICVPFIVIPIYVEYTPIVIETINPEVSGFEVASQDAGNTINWEQWLYLIYGLGLTLFLGKLIIELTSLSLLFKQHKYYKNGKYVFIKTENDIPPFSFFNWIIYNPNKYGQDELQHILHHEKAHAKDWHSMDIILAQLACVIFWFNPFTWLYKKEIEQNLEFIADKEAQEIAKCEKSYQLLLLKSSIPNHKYLITNNFYNSQIKKRIIMLHKSKSSKIKFWKFGLLIPALGLFLMSFNTKTIFIEKEKAQNLDDTLQVEATEQLNEFYDTIDTTEKTKDKTKSLKSKSKVKSAVKVKPNVVTPISDNEISITVIDKNTSDAELDKIKSNLKKEGLTVKFKGVKRNSQGEITAIKIDAKSTNSNASYNVNSDKAINAIKIVYDEEKDSIVIGNSHNKHGDHVYVFESEEGEGAKYKFRKSGTGSNVFVISEEEHEDEHEHEDTKIVVRGHANNGKVKMVKRSKNVEVISGDDEKVEIIIEEDKDNDNEVIIVNGKRVNIDESEDNKVVVKGYNVWKSKDGEKEDIIAIQNENSNNIFISGDSDKKPLFIVDGKEIDSDKIQDINPKNIESVTVLKDKSAMEKYGDKGKNGVVIIKTRKN